jgi:hypothetical protein
VALLPVLLLIVPQPPPLEADSQPLHGESDTHSPDYCLLLLLIVDINLPPVADVGPKALLLRGLKRMQRPLGLTNVPRVQQISQDEVQVRNSVPFVGQGIFGLGEQFSLLVKFQGIEGCFDGGCDGLVLEFCRQ